jgi:TPR repeat protein
MYYKGEGVPQDYETAVKWYTRAADQGDSNAQHYLGVMFANGQGVPEDFIYAHMWFSISALNGNANGRKFREIIEKRMIAAQIGIAEELAQKCARNQCKDC